MEDRSYKSTEEYIRIRIESLKREYYERIYQLRKQHEDSRDKWKKDSGLSDALEAAYHEELNQIKKSFEQKSREMQEEISSLVKVGSTKIRNHLKELESKLQELFRLIHKTPV